MIRKLQRRFIVIAVSAVAAVLAVIMGVICVSLYSGVVSDADRTLGMLAQNNGHYPQIDKGGSGGENGAFMMKPRQETSPEAPFETRFFAVYLNKNGGVLSVNTGSIAAVATDEAAGYAQTIYESGREKGFLGVYRFSVTKADAGTLIIFLDSTRGLDLFYKFLETSLGVSLLGLFGVFVLVLLFSKRAIKPIADSYEKQKHFITDASHELKTPLTVISASTDVLELTQGESEWTQSIRNQTERLAALTNSLVSLARLDERDSGPMMTDFSLSDAVSESLEPFAALAAQKGRRFETDIQKNVSYHGCEDEIRKLVGILADNAVKYAGEDGTISVLLRDPPKGPLLQFKNPADGLAKGSHDELFERFYRADASHSAAIGGFGIGLSIARAIVDAHKGKINARSEDGKSLTVSAYL